MTSVFEPRYRFLDRVPKTLFGPVVRHIHGELEPRARAIARLREGLLDGKLPPRAELRWPDPSLRDPLFDALDVSGIVPLCSANPELTDDVLLYILDAVHEAERLFERGLVSFTHIVCRQCIGAGGSGTRGGPEAWRALFGEDEWARIRGEAMALAADMAREMLRTRTDAEWTLRAMLLRELGDLLEQLCLSLKLPPGTAAGFLRALGRSQLLQLRTILSELAPLTELIEKLGRGEETDDPDAPIVLEQIGALIQREREASMPEEDEGPIDLRGVERSGELARMLPSEAALLTRPVLRKLWRARWVERSLMTYHARGVLTQRIQTRQTFEEGISEEQRRMQRGPVVLILDTSGSMWGTRDRLAKAVALQIASTAFMEERPCYVYNFSGNGNLIEHQLTFDGAGITEVLAFLTLSFGGGTVPDEALRRAMLRLESKEWRLADLVMLSDGEFWIEDHVVQRWHALKSRVDARAIAIRVGSGDGFDALPFDEIHDLGDWRQMFDVSEVR